MKYLFLMFLILGGINLAYPQKPLIDTSAYGDFPVLKSPVISNDGKYFAYTINLPDRPKSQSRLIVMSTKYNKIIADRRIAGRMSITSDSRYCVYMKDGNELEILELGSGKIRVVPHVAYYMNTTEENPERLMYSSISSGKEIGLLNLRTGKSTLFSGRYGNLTNDGNSLIIKKENSLDWVDLTSGKTHVLWSGAGLGNTVVYDLKNNQLAFKSNDSLFFFKQGMIKPVCIANSENVWTESRLVLGTIDRFNQSGTSLFINLMHKGHLKLASNPDEVEVWSYMDKKINSLPGQDRDQDNNPVRALIKLNDKKLVQFQRKQSEFQSGIEQGGKVLLCYSSGGGEMNEYWNSTGQVSYDLLNTLTGERKSLPWLDRFSVPLLSPTGRFIIFFDKKRKSYFSYNVNSEARIDLTGSIRNDISDNSTYTGTSTFEQRGIGGWLANDEAVFIYGTNDIWKIDPLGKIAPINFTNGYGTKNNIIFDFALSNPSAPITISKNEPVFLSAFNSESKDNGFFNVQMGVNKDPKKLFMGPYFFKNESGHTVGYHSFTPIKAKYASQYLLRRMSTNDAPNYFCTSDFSLFDRLSDFQPQKKYNWYTAELHKWKSLDGGSLKGVLYKPENFDESKEYPVIFYIYEQLSDGLNIYLEPQSSNGQLDIATYVSNGYLVFCPDILYQIGNPMRGAYDALVSAATYISRLPFVNAKKMGIQGHSWGAQQVNHLITRTSLFAAACSSSGSADWISLYGTVGLEGALYGGVLENGQFRIGSSLWENPQAYAENSAILGAHKVNTPLLMKQGKVDVGSPFSNAFEFFLGLRRLGKKVWMLAYPKAGHLLRGDDSRDFTIRMMQFFDHYLKDKPTPKWMLNVMSGYQEGTSEGYVLDSTGAVPGRGILTREDQERADSLMTSEPINLKTN